MASPERVRGTIQVVGTDRAITVKDAVAPKKGPPAARFVGGATYHPTKSYSFAAHFVEVAVDTGTSQITVQQVVPVHEIGKVIHPVAATGRIEGGIRQRIGHTLYQDYQIDMTTGSFRHKRIVAVPVWRQPRPKHE
ncbi:MAG: molybdopterin cofactor-binding domain-containing protein [Caldimonas sp.]